MNRRTLLALGVALGCGATDKDDMYPGFGFGNGGAGYAPFTTTVAQSSASASWGVFSTTRYAATTGAGIGPDLAIGNSVGILFWLNSIPTGDSSPLSYCSATKGWFFDINSAGNLYLALKPTGTFVIGAVAVGLNCVWVTRIASGALRASLNGAAAISLSASPSYVTNDASSIYAIGKCQGLNSMPLTVGAVIETAHVGAEFSDSELTAASGCVNAVDRFRMTDAVRQHVNLVDNLQVPRDWNGVASTVTGGSGSAPKTLTLVGAGHAKNPIKAQNVRYFSREEFLDNQLWIAEAGRRQVSEYARNRITTTAPAIAVDFWQGQSGGPNTWQAVGLVKDGTFLRTVQTDAQNVQRCVDVLGLSGSHVYDIVAGVKFLVGGNVVGAYPVAVRYDVDQSISVQAETTPTDVLVFYGDSIISGDHCTTVGPVAGAASMLCRTAFAAAKTDGRVRMVAHGSRSMHDDIGTSGVLDSTKLAAFVASFAPILNGTVSNTLYIQVETNDYGIPPGKWGTVANFNTAKAALVDAFHASYPSLAIFLQTATTRQNEGTNNTSGWNLTQARAGDATCASTRPWLTLVDGPSMVTYDGTSTGDYYTDLLHLRDIGQSNYATSIRAPLGF